MKQLYIIPANNGGCVEFREGATGYSVEVNQTQVFWSVNHSEAQRVFTKLVVALEAK